MLSRGRDRILRINGGILGVDIIDLIEEGVDKAQSFSKGVLGKHATGNINLGSDNANPLQNSESC